MKTSEQFSLAVKTLRVLEEKNQNRQHRYAAVEVPFLPKARNSVRSVCILCFLADLMLINPASQYNPV